MYKHFVKLHILVQETPLSHPQLVDTFNYSDIQSIYVQKSDYALFDKIPYCLSHYAALNSLDQKLKKKC